MQDMDRKSLFFFPKRSEQSGGDRIRDGKFRLRSLLPQRFSDGKTPHQVPRGDVRIPIRPYQNRFSVFHGSYPFLMIPREAGRHDVIVPDCASRNYYAQSLYHSAAAASNKENQVIF